MTTACARSFHSCHKFLAAPSATRLATFASMIAMLLFVEHGLISFAYNLTKVNVHENQERFTSSNTHVEAPAASGCIVTGFNEGHATEAHAMILSASKVLPSWKIFVYDLGLHLTTQRQLQKLVEVRLPPTTIPEWALSFERGTTSFKAWILEHLASTDVCNLTMYADTSIRFQTSFADFVQSNDTLLDINLFQISGRQVNWTHPQMYKWFSRLESDCTLRQYQGGSILFRQNSKLWKDVFTLWKKCSQFKQCMLPDDALIKKRNAVGGYIAHRDDQSALNFALVSVVGENTFNSFNTLKLHIQVRRACVRRRSQMLSVR